MQTATLTGLVRPHPGQLRLPKFSVPAETEFQFPESDLDYLTTKAGTLVTHAGLMVAWIYQGIAGSRNNPKRCTFFDVAFPSFSFGQQNRVTGLMLDSASFDSMADAVSFVERTFGSEVAA